MASEESVRDVIVIGGGIAGAGVAREAALRGLSVALFEKNAFASGTSGKSSKLIHGGLRYLELSWDALLAGRPGEAWKNLRFVFFLLRECRILRRTAPGLVEPVEFAVPVYRGGRRSLFTVMAGTAAYALLSLPWGGFRAPRFLSAAALLKRVPGLKEEGLAGGVTFWDHATDDRALVRAVIAAAERAGTECREHAAVVRYWKADGVFHVEVRSADGTRVRRARHLVDATGAWVDKTRALGGEGGPAIVHPVAGSHVEVARFLPLSLVLEASDGRVFFAVNRGDRSRVGTTEWVCADPDAVAPTERDVEYLLASLNRYFPKKNFTRADILASDAGVRPLVRTDSGSGPTGISREHALVAGQDGALHLVGVKLTDHRRAAQAAVDRFTRAGSKTARESL